MTRNTIDMTANRYTTPIDDLSDIDLYRMAAAVERDLSGDPYEFESDADLQAAFDRHSALKDEQKARDPRRDDPHFAPFDSVDRYEATVSNVTITHVPGYNERDRYSVTIEFAPETFDSWTFTTTAGDDDRSAVGQVVLDAYELDDPRDAGHLVGQTFPLVGDRDGVGWGRVDRYSLEHGHPAPTVRADPDDIRVAGGNR